MLFSNLGKYNFLQGYFKVSEPSINQFIPDVLDAIYEYLKTTLKVAVISRRAFYCITFYSPMLYFILFIYLLHFYFYCYY